MKSFVFQYRGRVLSEKDVDDIRHIISGHFHKGRSHISRVLCQHWNWRQHNGNFKDYAARDLLLRLEERGLVKLPARLRPKNNLKRKSFDQTPLFKSPPLCGPIGRFSDIKLGLVETGDDYLWGYLLSHYHYLGLPRLVGEHRRYFAYINGHVVACLAWASAAFKLKSRDDYIGWSPEVRRQRLHLIANNVRFLILPWIQVKHLASKVLALNLRRVSHDWQKAYHHRIYLAETFVDTDRFSGTCYKASNWQRVGETRGSAKRGNAYQFHGQSKTVYLYPLVSNFRKRLIDDQG
jgi:hypothetical protein